MSIECKSLLDHSASILATPAGATRAKCLLEEGADIPTIIESFADLSGDATQAALLRHEMAELPPVVVTTILHAWALAESANKPLRLESVVPSNPLEFARTRRVSVSLAVDEAGVVVSLSHIPTRHADWYGAVGRVA